MRLNHALTKSLVEHSYISQLTKDEKIISSDMTKSMVKLKYILLTLKESNTSNSTTMEQVYNARYTYGISKRGRVKAGKETTNKWRWTRNKGGKIAQIRQFTYIVGCERSFDGAGR